MDDDWGYLLGALVSIVGFTTLIEPSTPAVEIVWGACYLILAALCTYGAISYND